ncbi:7587_t:CDS:2, partial [Funneliformis mosseae]
FIYCGNVDLTGLQKLELLQLFMALDEINIQPLMTHVQKYLTEHIAMFTKFDSIEMLKIIHQHEFFTELWDEHLEIICEEPRVLLSSKDFTSLSEMFLMDILKCNTLKVDEITIWESVLKWGLDKHPSFVKDAKKWDKAQFKILRTTLNKIIPLVNFRDFDSTTFFYQVLPYQKLLPKDELYDILEKHLVRINNRPTLTRYRQASNSNILNLHHLAIFSTWMDKKNSYYKIHKNPHKFKSLYHQLLCEDFYFKSNIMDLGMLHSSYAIHYNDRCEIGFGSGHDLNCKSDGNWTSVPTYYPSIGIPAVFKISQYEIFEVVRFFNGK